MNTNTPRTDAARLWHFDEPVVPMGFACELEVEAAFWQAKAHEAEEHEGKQEAEVERLTDALKSCWHAAKPKLTRESYDENWNMKQTDTPRTDAAAFGSMTDSWELEQLSRKLERELNESNRLKNLALSRMDDALEKAESLSTPDCHICRNKCQRPLCILSKQLAASRAEVERLTKLTEDCLDVIRVYCPTYYHEELADELNQLKATLNPTK